MSNMSFAIAVVALTLAGGIILARIIIEILEWRERRKQAATAVPEQLQVEPVAERSWGARVGNLCQFGETWIDLANIEIIEFGPEDGCGCEIQFRGTGIRWHVTPEDAACIRAYLTGMDAICGRREAAHSDQRD